MFDMIDDGLSVCVPDDPTGNAKLMFSILECLPRSHQNTVLFLMDHVKLVHINSDRNKMTSQALAICFGPLFSCYDQSDSVYKPIQVFKFLLDIWPRRKGAFNLLKKFDDTKVSEVTSITTSICPSSTFNSSTTRLASSSHHQYKPLTTTTSIKESVSHYDSPHTSSYRFQSSSLATTTVHDSLFSKTTTNNQTITTWSSTGSGRMLPSTQNATRTIFSYSNTKYKVPTCSSGSSIINPTCTITTINRTTDSLISSGLYQSRFITSTSNYDVLPSRTFSSHFTSGYGSDLSTTTRSASFYQSSLYSSSSEVIDQTYKKYLTPSTSTTSSTITSSVEALYSTVNKSVSKTTPSNTYQPRTKFENKDDDNSDFLYSKRSTLKDGQESSPTSYHSPTKNIGSTSLDQKPLISGGGPSSTQLYPSRLTSSITTTTVGNHSIISSYTTSYSNNYISSPYSTDYSSGYGGSTLSNKLYSLRRNDFDSSNESTDVNHNFLSKINSSKVTTSSSILNDDNINFTSSAFTDFKESTTMVDPLTTTTTTTSSNTILGSSSYQHRSNHQYSNNNDIDDENVL